MSILENIYSGDYTPDKAAEKLPFSVERSRLQKCV